ncbi:CRISPR-associated protein Cas4 [Methylococcus capsulatus]|jgi:CRISPR-associated exonuclease Cas4|uniref:CRISPR-associated protein Cas4 n=1 Tax=Methylococcus capsulatus TaxID=414 RepID=UPI0002DFDCB1|nr:CRISPR-associated protein Cas4 [Methylococcus capsulatus]QXP88541.1 CRISPR-associated protein Cas4 [Methylococcus capsulatus]
MDETLPIPLSALQHYSYCPRQCALIHQEQMFTDNVFTLRGRRVHERVDEPDTRHEAGVRIEQALTLFSDRLGLTGKADIVEFLPDGTPRPVEYKHGPRRQREHDDVQVAAQALCLEEMTGKEVPEGVIYHHGSRRRRVVPITPELRIKTERLIHEVRALLGPGKLPPPASEPERCRGCSMIEICQPEMLKSAAEIDRLAQTLFEPEEDLP